MRKFRSRVQAMSQVKDLHGLEEAHRLEFARFRQEITGEVDFLDDA